MSSPGRVIRSLLLTLGIPILLVPCGAQDGRIQFRLAYGPGLSSGSSSAAWTQTVYQEEASYAVDYGIGPGRSFYAGLGYLFTDAVGIGFALDRTEKDLSAECRIRIPHPLYFNSPREARGTVAGGLTESVLSLDLLGRWSFGTIGVGVWAGPAVLFARADLVGAIPFTESEYPFESVSLDSRTERLKRDVLGLSLGGSLDFRLFRGLALSVIARYLTARAAFQPSGDVPSQELPLGGFKIGGGLRLTL